MNRIVVLSGGLDSSTLLVYQLRKASRKGEVIPLVFNYGQRCWQMELDAVHKVLDAVGVNQLKTVNIPQLAFVMGSNVITDTRREVPQQSLGLELYHELEDHVVPNRNVIMVEIAVAYALSLKQPALVTYGAQASDDPDFDLFADVQPDCVKILDQMANYTSKGMVRVHAPFVQMVKSQVIQKAVELKVPTKLTWSCYNNGVGPKKLHCGDCCSCVDRRLAFQVVGLSKYDVEYARDLKG